MVGDTNTPPSDNTSYGYPGEGCDTDTKPPTQKTLTLGCYTVNQARAMCRESIREAVQGS